MEITNSLDEAISMYSSNEVYKLLAELRQLIRAKSAGLIEDSSSPTTPTADPVSDYDLVKFLMGRSMNPKKAYEMYTSTMKWRKESNVDSLPLSSLPQPNNCRGLSTALLDVDLDTSSPSVPESWKLFVHNLGGGCYHKTDKCGLPLFIEALGKTNPKELVSQCPPEGLLDFHLHNIEFLRKVLMRECSLKANIVIDKQTVIMDLKGLGWNHLNMKFLMLMKTIADLDQAYYPEALHRIFIINSPTVFTALWAIVKMWLDQRILDKIMILSHDYSSTLLRYIDEDNLPTFYGGKCTCSHMKTGCHPNIN